MNVTIHTHVRRGFHTKVNNTVDCEEIVGK